VLRGSTNTHRALTRVAAGCSTTPQREQIPLEALITLLFCAPLSTTWLLYRFTVNLQGRR
jgi:hypothetical protein